MTINIRCDCGKQFRVDPNLAGRGFPCPLCGQMHSLAPLEGPADSRSAPVPQPASTDGKQDQNVQWAPIAGAIAAALLICMALLWALLGGSGTAVQGPESPEPPAPVAVKAKDDKPKPPAPAVVQAKDDKPKPPAPATKPASKPTPAALSPADLFVKASPAVVRITVRDKDFKAIALGSGFFISKDGLLVTNQHVMKDAHFASVQLSNGVTFFVDGVMAVDTAADLALLKVNGKDFAHLSLGKDAIPKVGTKVFAIGNPQGLTNTFSQGIVSGHRQPTEDLTIVQTTAAISPGSSGGPLLNAQGEVVGVTTAYLMDGQNLNFAVPAVVVRRLIGNQGKLQALASAGGTPLDKAATEELDKAWVAMGRKDWHAAAKILTTLRKTQKDNPFVWFALGYLHGELGNLEIAVDMYKKALAIKPDFAEAYCNMGAAYDDLKRYTDALAASKKAIAIKPDYADVYNNMGIAYNNLGQYADAFAAYKKAIAIEPDHAEAHNNMGATYAGLKRYTDALAAYKKAITIKPDYADAYYNTGLAYDSLKRYTDAIPAYETALRLAPDASWADVAREFLAEARRALRVRRTDPR